MMLIAASDHSKVDRGAENEPKDVDTLDRDSSMKHPSVNECRQGQKYKAKNQKDQIVVIRCVQIAAEEEQKRQRDPREQQYEDEQAAGHSAINCTTSRLTRIRLGCFTQSGENW